MFEIEIYKKAKKDSQIREELNKDSTNAFICVYQDGDQTHILSGSDEANKADIVALLVALDDITDDLCRKDKQIASAYGLYKLKKAAGMLTELKLAEEQEESGDEQKD
nr:MAG TPA: hypothetical protein [Caudoviricetes sp.]